MRKVRSSDKSWTFALAPREQEFLLAVLRAYPVTPKSHHQLSRDSAEDIDPEDQRLLEEAIAEQRAGNKFRVQRWLAGNRLRKVEDEWEFDLATNELDWLLQVFNDVRVGYWVQLGEPGDLSNPIDLLQKNPAAFFFMEAAGMFQMQLLETLYGGGE